MHTFDYHNQEHLALLLLLIIIIILMLFIIKYKVNNYWQERKVRKRFERGNKLELQARNFLKSKGYTIVDYQGNYEHHYIENGERHTASIQPDYIVKKNGRKYIVEVKSGFQAISARNKNTRRQLLEYDYVVENDGVFLLDMENHQMKLVQFKSKMERRSGRLLKAIIITALVGMAIPYWQIKVGIALILLIVFFMERRL
ncbi:MULTISPECIES: hypothetical protein [unclassified Carboxylicivirga]|uniref:hypothetical protein n=1 Tax=Carboxylicivirga TaxID=1628153 RepID=UPI003D32F0CE